MDESIFRDDLLNRFAGHTFVETVDNDLILVQFKNGGGTVIMEYKKLDKPTAYRMIRDSLLDGSNALFTITTAQKDLLTNIPKGTFIFNETVQRIECYDGDAWVGSGGATVENSGTYGALYENNPNGSTLSGAGVVKGWTSAIFGSVSSATPVTFLDNATADRLVVGAGGAGDYHISFSASLTNSNTSNLTTGSIYKDEVEQVSISDDVSGHPARHRNIVAGSIITLAVGEYISLRFESDTASDVIKVYQCHVNIIKVS